MDYFAYHYPAAVTKNRAVSQCDKAKRFSVAILNHNTSDVEVKSALAGRHRFGTISLNATGSTESMAVIATPEMSIAHAKALERLDRLGLLISVVVDEAHLATNSGWSVCLHV